LVALPIASEIRRHPFAHGEAGEPQWAQNGRSI